MEPVGFRQPQKVISSRIIFLEAVNSVSINRYICRLKFSFMFEQVVGDGANLFLTIVAVLIGFASALGYQDYKKTKKEEQQH